MDTELNKNTSVVIPLNDYLTVAANDGPEMVKEADTDYMLNELQNLTPGGQDGLNRTFCTTGEWQC